MILIDCNHDCFLQSLVSVNHQSECQGRGHSDSELFLDVGYPIHIATDDAGTGDKRGEVHRWKSQLERSCEFLLSPVLIHQCCLITKCNHLRKRNNIPQNSREDSSVEHKHNRWKQQQVFTGARHCWFPIDITIYYVPSLDGLWKFFNCNKTLGHAKSAFSSLQAKLIWPTTIYNRENRNV